MTNRTNSRLVPLYIVEGGRRNFEEFESMVYGLISEILVNSTEFTELEGLRGYRVSDFFITPIDLENQVYYFLEDLCEQCYGKPLKDLLLIVEILKDGRVCLECNAETIYGSIITVDSVTDEPVRVQVEYDFSLNRP